jgi:hypothetical protein
MIKPDSLSADCRRCDQLILLSIVKSPLSEHWESLPPPALLDGLVDSLGPVHRLGIIYRANPGSSSTILNPSLTFAGTLPGSGKVESDSRLGDDFKESCTGASGVCYKSALQVSCEPCVMRGMFVRL